MWFQQIHMPPPPFPPFLVTIKFCFAWVKYICSFFLFMIMACGSFDIHLFFKTEILVTFLVCNKTRLNFESLLRYNGEQKEQQIPHCRNSSKIK